MEQEDNDHLRYRIDCEGKSNDRWLIVEVDIRLDQSYKLVINISGQQLVDGARRVEHTATTLQELGRCMITMSALLAEQYQTHALRTTGEGLIKLGDEEDALARLEGGPDVS